MLNNRIFDLVMFVILGLLSYGFYSGRASWLLIYYGCAPKKLREQMDCVRLNNISGTMAMVAAALEFLNWFLQIFGIIFFREILRLCAILVMIIMVFWTYKVSREYKGVNKR